MRRFCFSTIAVAAACGGSAPATSTIRDSAGVMVAETPAAALPAAPVWRLADPPLLQIGAIEGDPARQFAGIETVLRRPDGTIVVADRGSAELRFFDDRGRHLASHGRAGEAPGEYRYLSGVGIGAGDSLWAFDFGMRRFTVLEPTGGAVRTVSVGPALSAVTAVGYLREGGFVIREQWSAAAHATVATGLVRHPAAVALLGADGATLDTVALVPGREVSIGSEGGRAVMRTPLLARHAVAATDGELVFVGDQATFEIRAFAATGTLRRIIRITGLDLTVTAEVIRGATEARLNDAPDDRRAMLRAQLAEMATPPTRPAFGSVLLDDAGNLWVGSHEYAGPSRAWTVFDTAGSLAGSVAMPPGFDLRQVTGDRAVGTWRDALDVEYVQVRQVERPPGGPRSPPP